MAAGTVLGYLKYVLGFDSVQFRKGMSDAERELVVRQKSFIKSGQKLQGLGKSMAAFITLPLAGLAAAGIKEAQETVAAMAQVNAALASMGPVAQRTAPQLQAAANAFEGSSLFEADQILKQVTANMLTFGNVSGQQFDRAQQAALNLSARLGTDLTAATLLVGKALNDPVKGMTAMTRAGIQFTDQQKAQIKAMVEAGNVAGAQKIILAELERQFGGAAKAAQDADPWNKVIDAFKNMAESIGTALLPLIPPLTNAIVGLLSAFTSLSPETQKWLIIAGGAVAILGPVIGTIGTIMKVLGPMLPLILKLGPAWAALKVAFVAARVAALTTLPALVPFLVPLGALALAVGAVYLAWKNWDKISAIAKAVYSAVKTWIVDKLNAVWDGVKAKVAAVGDWFHGLYERVVGHSDIPDMVTGIGAWMAKLDSLMVLPAAKATGATGDKFQEMRDRVSALLDQLFPENAQFREFENNIKTLQDAAKAGILTADQLETAMQRLRGADQAKVDLADATPLESLSGGLEEVVAANDNLVASAKRTAVETIQAYGDMAAGVIGSMKNLVGQLRSGDILGALQSVLDMVRGVLDTLVRVGVLKVPGGADPATPRASGGPVVPGRTYLVGENGPEYLRFGSRGFIAPPKGGDGGARVTIVPSRYFDATVDGRAAAVAAPMAGRAAMAGASGGASAVQRQHARNLYTGRR